jgi:hypothetical protein
MITAAQNKRLSSVMNAARDEGYFPSYVDTIGKGRISHMSAYEITSRMDNRAVRVYEARAAYQLKQFRDSKPLYADEDLNSVRGFFYQAGIIEGGFNDENSFA